MHPEHNHRGTTFDTHAGRRVDMVHKRAALTVPSSATRSTGLPTSACPEPQHHRVPVRIRLTLRAIWAYLAAFRMVAEVNLRETVQNVQDLRGLLSLDDNRDLICERKLCPMIFSLTVLIATVHNVSVLIRNENR